MTDSLLTHPIDETAQPASTASDPAKPEGVPDKFWDTEKKEIRVNALLASYLALEKKLGQSLPLPQSEADRLKIWKSLGVPDRPEDYTVTVANDLFQVDPDLNARLHTKGFTPEQVQEVYDLAAEKMVPLILEMAAEFQADREVERLVAEFGGVEQWQKVSRQLLEYGRRNLPPSVLEGMACSFEGVMALYHLMKGEASSLKAKSGSAAATNETDLRAMMQNPKYWRDKDPAFIAQVTAGFEKLYSN